MIGILGNLVMIPEWVARSMTDVLGRSILDGRGQSPDTKLHVSAADRRGLVKVSGGKLVVIELDMKQVIAESISDFFKKGHGTADDLDFGRFGIVIQPDSEDAVVTITVVGIGSVVFTKEDHRNQFIWLYEIQ